jgi:hypothetical protein
VKPCKRTHTYSTTQSTHGMAVPALQADPPSTPFPLTAQAPLLAHTYTQTPVQTHTHTPTPHGPSSHSPTLPHRHPSHTHTQSLQHNTDKAASPLLDASARPCTCLHTSLAAFPPKRRHDRSVRSCTVPASSSPPSQHPASQYRLQAGVSQHTVHWTARTRARCKTAVSCQAVLPERCSSSGRPQLRHDQTRLASVPSPQHSALVKACTLSGESVRSCADTYTTTTGHRNNEAPTSRLIAGAYTHSYMDTQQERYTGRLAPRQQ